MINELKIQHLPYVDGMPYDGQTRINWIKNGERICAATTPTSSDGTLNRPSVQLQANCVLLETNDSAIEEKVNEIVEVVNNINESLSQVGDTQIIDLVNADNLRIRHLEEINVITDNRISDTERDVTHINNAIGDRDPQDKSDRTIMGELYFQKKEMGSYPGFNMDGLPDVTNPGSGMKYRIAQTSLALATYDQRITKLENDFITSDVGNLTIQIDKLRTEIGPESSAIGLNLYLRTTAVENRSTANETAIAAIKTAIDFVNVTPIKDRVTSLETSYELINTAINTPTSGLIDKVSSLDAVVGDATKPGTVVAEIARLDAADTNLYDIIGKTDSDGIRGQMADLNTLIGSDQTPNSVLGRVSSVETKTSALNVEVNQLEQTVGSSSSGLVAASILMSHDLYGNPSAVDPIEKNGIKQTVIGLDNTLNTEVVKKPSDDLAYYIENGNLTPFANIMVDCRVINKVLNIPTENVKTPIPVDGADQDVLHNAELVTNSVRMKRAGTIKIDYVLEVDGVSDVCVYNTYATVTNNDGSQTKRTIAGSLIGFDGTTRFYSLKGLVNVSVDDLITVSVSAANTSSTGDATVNYLDMIITPVLS